MEEKMDVSTHLVPIKYLSPLLGDVSTLSIIKKISNTVSLPLSNPQIALHFPSILFPQTPHPSLFPLPPAFNPPGQPIYFTVIVKLHLIIILNIVWHLMHFISLAVITLILAIIVPLQTYSTSNTFKHYLAEAGQISFVTVPSIIFSYPIPFYLPFSRNPTVIITISFIRYHPLDSRQYFDLKSKEDISHTSATIEMVWQFAPAVTALNLRYYAFDPERAGSISHMRTQHRIYHDKDEDKQVVDVDRNISYPSIKVHCFIQQSRGVKQKGTNYELQVNCGKEGDTKFKVTVECDEDFEGLEYEYYHMTFKYKYFAVNTLIIQERDSWELDNGILRAENSIQSTQIPKGSPITSTEMIIIGLRDWKVEGRGLEFGLVNTGQYVYTGSYQYVRYSYYTIIKKGGEFVYLHRMQSYISIASIFLVYKNFTNNMSKAYSDSFSLSNYDGIEKGDSSQGAHALERKIQYILKKPATNTDITAYYYYSYVTEFHEKESRIRIIIITSMVIYVERRIFKMEIVNARDATKTNFDLSGAGITLVNTTQKGDDTELYFSFTDNAFGVDAGIVYTDDANEDKVIHRYRFPKFSRMESSVKKDKIRVILNHMQEVQNSPTSQFKLRPNIDFLGDMEAKKGSDTVVEFAYKLNNDDLRQGVLAVDYVWNKDTEYPLSFEGIRVMTAIHLLHTNVTNTYELTLINLYKRQNIVKTQFTTPQAGITFKDVRIEDVDIVLVIEADPSAGGNYDITFIPDSYYQVLIKDIQTVERFKSISSERYQNNLFIRLNNPSFLDNNTLPTIVLNHPAITVEDIYVNDDNQIFINALYNETIDGSMLEIHYSQNTTQSTYFQTFQFKLIYTFPLVYCVGKLDSLSKLYYMLANLIQYAYLGVFGLAVIFMNKLAGVEMMILIQFAYYSLINIRVHCPYVGLSMMKYVSGYNPLFSDSPQETISLRYSDLGIHSNFLSNVNLMVFILGACPVMFAILMIMAKRSDCYKKKPRYLKYGRAFVFEIPLTIILFNAFNIYTSLVVQVKYFQSDNIVPMAVAIIVALILPAYALIYFFFKKKFSEFREEFETNEKIGSFTKETSVAIRQAYPLVVMLEFAVFPFLLSIESILNFSFYGALVLALFASVFTMVATPYIHKIDNLRLLLHRLILLGVIGCQIMFKSLANQGTLHGGFIFYIPMVLLGLLAAGLLLNGLNILRLSFLWIRKRGIIDHNMKMAKQSTKTKPKQTYPAGSDDMWYPKLQFGEFKREQIAAVRKNLKSNFVVQQNLLGTCEEQAL